MVFSSTGAEQINRHPPTCSAEAPPTTRGFCKSKSTQMWRENDDVCRERNVQILSPVCPAQPSTSRVLHREYHLAGLYIWPSASPLDRYRLLSTVHFHMSPQITGPRGCIVTVVTFGWLFSSVWSHLAGLYIWLSGPFLDRYGPLPKEILPPFAQPGFNSCSIFSNLPHIPPFTPT